METSILGSQIFKEPDIILEGSPANLEARLFEEFILWKAQPSVFGILGIATDKTWGSKYLGKPNIWVSQIWGRHYLR